MSEISAIKGFNALSKTKNTEIIKHKGCATKQKELLNLFNNLLDTILTNKTLKSESQGDKNKNQNDNTLMSSKDENKNSNENGNDSTLISSKDEKENENENENGKTLMSSKDENDNENENDDETMS